MTLLDVLRPHRRIMAFPPDLSQDGRTAGWTGQLARRGPGVHRAPMSNARFYLAGLTVAAAAILFAAFASEWWGGLVPCALCLVERWPYRVAIGVGVIGMVVPERFLRLAFALYGLAMLG